MATRTAPKSAAKSATKTIKPRATRATKPAAKPAAKRGSGSGEPASETRGPSAATLAFAKRVVTLRDKDGLAWAEVAQKLGVPYDHNGSSRLRRAYTLGQGRTVGVRKAREEAKAQTAKPAARRSRSSASAATAKKVAPRRRAK